MMSAINHVKCTTGGCGNWPCGGRADPAWPSLNGLGAGARLLLATVCRPGPGPAIQFNCHLPPELPIKFQRYSKFRPCHAPGAACLAGSTILEFKMELDRPMSSNLSITLWTCTLLHKYTSLTTNCLHNLNNIMWKTFLAIKVNLNGKANWILLRSVFFL